MIRIALFTFLLVVSTMARGQDTPAPEGPMTMERMAGIIAALDPGVSQRGPTFEIYGSGHPRHRDR